MCCMLISVSIWCLSRRAIEIKKGQGVNLGLVEYELVREMIRMVDRC